MTIAQTILVGVVGLVRGRPRLLAALRPRRRRSIVLSVAFATLIVYLIRRSRGGSLTDPGRGPRNDR